MAHIIYQSHWQKGADRERMQEQIPERSHDKWEGKHLLPHPLPICSLLPWALIGLERSHDKWEGMHPLPHPLQHPLPIRSLLPLAVIDVPIQSNNKQNRADAAADAGANEGVNFQQISNFSYK